MTARQSVRIEAEGRNRARLLSVLQREGIEIGTFREVSSQKFAFSISKKDLHKTFAILDEMCYTYTTTGITGRERWWRRLLFRVGLPAGILVFSVLLALARGFVWRVEITGNENVPDKVIENVLAEHGIGAGKRLSAFDSDELTTAIRAIDGITLASVWRKGTTIGVEVFEREQTAPPLSYSDTDILSKYDATVTRVITRTGTALVEVGQNVFAGTPLIGAYRTTEEGADPLPVPASGIVYGRIAHTVSTTVATERYERVPASVSYRTRLSLFGLTLGKALPSGTGYDIVETTEKFTAFLPIAVRTARITEWTTRKVSVPIETLAMQAEDEALLAFIGENAPSGYSATHTVRELGGGVYRINVFVQGEVVIGGV